MLSFRLALSWLAPAVPAVGIAWSLLVHAVPRRRRIALLREEDLTDWLLRDIGWKDGRDTAARRDASRAERIRRL